MDLVWHWLTYAFLVGLLVGAAMFVPRCQRAQASSDYSDIEGLDVTESKAVHAGVRVEALERGDPICYRLGDDEPLDALFGWVVATPGDEVSIAGGKVLVNGEPPRRGAAVLSQPAGPIRVPRDHVFVLSDMHRYDSIAYGPIPERALRGRVGDLP